MCELCVKETGIAEPEQAHQLVMGAIRQSHRLGFGNPFLISGCVCVMVPDGILRTNTWQNLAEFLKSYEED